MPGQDYIPDRAMTSSAQNKVLSTPDFLVSILSQLPHSSLLKAKLVNKTWASLFKLVDIQAALFEVPRPKEAALYAETYSDVLKNKFPIFWQFGKGSNVASIPKSYFAKSFPSEKGGTPLQATETSQPEPQGNSHWRQLLVCQPAIEVLEIVQHVDVRGLGVLEFRTTISRPNGLRMGFLYDAIRHWYEVERSFGVKLFWNRKTGDLTEHYRTYEDGPGYKTAEDRPCVTILGNTSVGCRQYGGLTYSNYCSKTYGKDQVIKSGDEEVEYSMSKRQKLGVDRGLFSAYLWGPQEDEEEEEEEEEEGEEGEEGEEEEED
ncbi:hypothetical protein F5884DRAFT_799303 [Xylogone sp. PMI_703]|nr:hypothetical protein F5884DRAFT_799303 [Xylogone sp. PMI_703]